jgi:glycosyltransferase involved in cell wall biosynthesis
MPEKNIDLTIITPCYNEEASVLDCAMEVQKIMSVMLPKVKYEHIFIDNASTDNTVAELRKIAGLSKNVKVIVNSRNVGPFRNMYAAMAKASGRAVIPMLPADLQDPADKIPDLYQEWVKGFLVVYGERTNRQESLVMRIFRGLYYRIVRTMSETDIPINSGEFMLIDRKISDEICKLGDHYPYIRGLVAQSSSNSTSVPYTWGVRKKGKSKSNLIALIDQAINGFVSTSRAPARIALLGGFFISGLGFLAGLWSLIANLVDAPSGLQGIPTIIVALFFFGGIQLFFLGLIGEYVLSIHSQVRRLPREFEVETINFK